MILTLQMGTASFNYSDISLVTIVTSLFNYSNINDPTYQDVVEDQLESEVVFLPDSGTEAYTMLRIILTTAFIVILYYNGKRVISWGCKKIRKITKKSEERKLEPRRKTAEHQGKIWRNMTEKLVSRQINRN